MYGKLRRGFSEKDDERLIEYMKAYRVLHDPHHKDYRNGYLKSELWKTIAELIGKDVDQCKKRWREMKDNYFKILRKERLSAGAAVPGPSRKWCLFDKLHFLSEVNGEQPPACGNPPPQESANIDPNAMTDDEEEKGNMPGGAHVENRNVTLKVVKSIPWEEIPGKGKKRMDLMEQMTCKICAEDDLDMFMKSITMSVKKLPPHGINRAKIEILVTLVRLQEDYPQAEETFCFQNMGFF